MLVLQRKPGERLLIGENIELIVNRVSGRRVVLAVQAPRSVRVVRSECGARSERIVRSDGATDAAAHDHNSPSEHQLSLRQKERQ